jgi:hypothetical protein
MMAIRPMVRFQRGFKEVLDVLATIPLAFTRGRG